MKAFAAAVAALSLLVAACGGDEALSPVPTESAGATPSPPATTTSVPDPKAPLPPVKRTVMTRNPFGGPAGNQLADGDFEMSFVPPGYIPQLGWIAFGDGGSTELALKAETGGICRSGLRCGVFEEDSILLGRGATANHNAGNVVSIWAKIPEGETCDVLRAILINCDTFATSKKLKAADDPDESGWCEYAGTTPERDSGQCLYLDSTLGAGQVALIDSAVVAPDDGTVAPRATEAWAPSAEQWERMQRVRKRVRDRLGFAAPPEPPLASK